MTRRRVLGLIFGSLIAVFLLGSAATVWAVRSELIGDIDDELALEMVNNVRFYDAVPLEQVTESGAEFAASVRATLIVSPDGEELRFVPAGDLADPLPRPTLTGVELADRVGEQYTVGSDDGPNYRVLVERLDDGRLIALAQPLDGIRTTLGSLTRVLLATLGAIIALEGLVFWWLLRLSLRPYDEMIDTAQAIAGGDLDRRAVNTTAAPEIERLTVSLNAMLDTIQTSFLAREAAEQRVKQFAADASHELRNPLATITGYSELYLSGAATDPESTAKQMSRIHSEAERMSRLVSDLLMLTRVDQGGGFQLVAVDLVEVAIDAVNDRKVVEPDHQLSLTIHDSALDGAATVVGDRDALHQVIVNLMANASVHAPGSPVDVGVAVIDGDVVVSVADQGPGMERVDAERVFDRFYRADRARTSASRSHGLGLSIVSTIAEALGGSVRVETAPGDGATFEVRLPAVLAGSA